MNEILCWTQKYYYDTNDDELHVKDENYVYSRSL